MTEDRLERVRREVFGHNAWRPGQEEVIGRVLAGRPTLAVMPTGSGKSLCFQLPALMFDGLTVVVSPLIALIKEQVAGLRARGLEVASWTSADAAKERSIATRGIREGTLRILYVAPERFRSDGFIELISKAKLELFTVDEAHCISQWGHDFRPDYARLGDAIHELAPKRVLAMTATATIDVQRDIARSLGLGDEPPIVTGFDRPNLSLSVEETRGRAKKARVLNEVISRWLGAPLPNARARKPKSRVKGSAIVYAATRKRSEEVAEELRGFGHRAAAYHAGLTNDTRSEVQESFTAGDIDVVVATTAFGMGIDKPDVRVVVHYDIPNAPEAYYQEIGRGGRDGDAAGAVLLYDPGDLRLAFLRIEWKCPTPAAVEQAFLALRRRERKGFVSGTIDEVADDLEPVVGASSRAALIDLVRSGSIEELPEGLLLKTSQARIDQPALENRARHERRKLDAMIEYVARASCRRRFLVDYFGDLHRPDRCGACDRCNRAPSGVVDDELALDVRKALSCVARLKGRYGRGRAIDVLLGSKNEELIKRRLHELSTYGMLGSYSKEELGALFDALARADMIAATVDDYPKVYLTVKGVRVMKAEEPVAIDFSRGEPRSTRTRRNPRDRGPESRR